MKWKTVLDNVNASGQWNGLSGVNFPMNGKLFVGYGDRLAKVDPGTGKVLANINLPTGPAKPDSLNFETIIAAPDGTIITKSQTRPLTTEQVQPRHRAPNRASTRCRTCKGKQPNTEVVAVNPDTMKVLNAITLPQPGRRPKPPRGVPGPHLHLPHGEQEHHPRRMESQNAEAHLRQELVTLIPERGTRGGASPCIIGNWVTVQTNAAPAKVPLSIVAVNQGNAKDLHRTDPIPLGDSPVSMIPAMHRNLRIN